MILKDFIKIVNEKLKKEFEKGTMIHFKLRDIMVESCDDSLFKKMIDYHEGRENLVTIDSDELVFKAKLKKMKHPSRESYSMSIEHIQVHTGFVSFANMELDDIYLYFKKKYAQKEQEIAHKHSKYVKDFEDMLKEKNLTHSEFKAMLEKYNLTNKI